MIMGISTDRQTNLTDATPTRNDKLTNVVLWGLVVAYVAATILRAILPNINTFPTILLLFPFTLIHGMKRYPWKGIAVFIVITLIVSGIMENLSILTGFPFGHYYYTDALGPKVTLVPILIFPSYIAFGYLAWVLSTLIVGIFRRGSTMFTTVAVPLVASFMMVAWDLSLDPIASTINQTWIWTQGGGYFGVPLTNFLGWSLTVYIFFQLTALYLRKRGSTDPSPVLPITHYLQIILVYMMTGIGFVLNYPFGPANTQITDAVGHVWQTNDIYETTAISSIYTMIFISILALAILFRDRPIQKGESTLTIAK
jgi:putative membrane protein